ncbi:hypothetical protein [Rhizobium acidisoli]|uniref:hypothetical protein n=1 Tax=Rhizobium acidisoli TaxID=1538158 RepID=UPI0006BA32E2|nr:hypothetical protein [Rhizobium acidisoli]KPH05120.1 hypothetical protein AOG23_29805 [Rhizobium acidisoli]
MDSTTTFSRPAPPTASAMQVAVLAHLDRTHLRLVEESFVCILRRNHPEADTPLTLDSFF